MLKPDVYNIIFSTQRTMNLRMAKVLLTLPITIEGCSEESLILKLAIRLLCSRDLSLTITQPKKNDGIYGNSAIRKS